MQLLLLCLLFIPLLILIFISPPIIAPSAAAIMSGTILYDVVIPTFTKGLKTLDHILTKAEEYSKVQGLDVNALVQARLIEDQLPFIFQVQNTTKTFNTTLGRLTGVESQPFEDKEKTFEDLHKRVQEALDLLVSVKHDAAQSQEDKEIDL
jgi:hypothetical protein